MSGIAGNGSALPVGYDNLLTNALMRTLRQGEYVNVTATAGSDVLAISGSGAHVFQSGNVEGAAGAAVPGAVVIRDVVSFSAAARQSLSGDQIALDLMSDARAEHGVARGRDNATGASAARTPDIQATAQAAVAQTGDTPDAEWLAARAVERAYQASTAAIANFQSLWAQGQRASAADRFYASYADPVQFQAITTNMTDARKADFTTAFSNRTLTISGEAGLGSMVTGSSTMHVEGQGDGISGGGFSAAPEDAPNTVIAWSALFGYSRVSWGDDPAKAES